MTEHVHDLGIGAEVSIVDETFEVYAECGCGYVLSQEEIEARLNATERLSAEDATAIANGWTSNATLRDTLRAYANILDGS